MSTESRKIPKVTPFTGAVGHSRSYDGFIVDIETVMKLANVKRSHRAHVASISLEDSAKEWWVNLPKHTRKHMSWKEFCQQLKARFVSSNANSEARRVQPTIRVIRDNNTTLQHNFQVFNQQFTDNQNKIVNQGHEDTVWQYMECIQKSIVAYPELQFCLTSVKHELDKLNENERTLITAQELAITAVSTLVGITHTTTNNNMHMMMYPSVIPSSNNNNLYMMNTPNNGIQYNLPTQYTAQQYTPHHNVPSNHIHYMQPAGVAPNQRKHGRSDKPLSYNEAIKQNVCTYCRDPSKQQHTVRSIINGESVVTCPVLKHEIDTGLKIDTYANKKRVKKEVHLNVLGSSALVSPAATTTY